MGLLIVFLLFLVLTKIWMNIAEQVGKDFGFHKIVEWLINKFEK